MRKAAHDRPQLAPHAAERGCSLPSEIRDTMTVSVCVVFDTAVEC